MVRGAAELRVKESDRIRLVVENLRRIGASAEELEDGFVVRGADGSLAGDIVTQGDHRIAMSFGVLAAASSGRLAIDDPACVQVSFPGFWNELERLTS